MPDSAVVYGVVRGVSAPAAELTATAETLLATLDVPDLVEVQPGPARPAPGDPPPHLLSRLYASRAEDLLALLSPAC